MPGIDFKEVRASVRIAEVLELIGFVPCTSTEQQLRGPCPVHRSSSTKSSCFSVNLAKNTYQCFKCGSAGNQLDLWAAATRTSTYEAALDLCNRLHRVDPGARRGDRQPILPLPSEDAHALEKRRGQFHRKRIMEAQRVDRDNRKPLLARG